jgi:methionyl-tRNA formyltransferase
MKIAFFALTGMGNTVLRSLVEIGRAPILVVTRQETGTYPYYDEIQVSEEANKLGIPVMIGEAGENETIRLKPDLILCSTYHRLISCKVISSAKHALNLHPSLLPLYPGKNPYYWTLINNDAVTGVSIHRLTDKFDRGQVILQKKIKIFSNETQGSLRFSLAQLAGEVIKEFFNHIDSLIALPLNSELTKTKYFRNVNEGDRIINLNCNAELICRQIRALTPWPGAVLKGIEGTVQQIMQVNYKPISRVLQGTVLSQSKTSIVVQVSDAEMVLTLDKNIYSDKDT